MIDGSLGRRSFRGVLAGGCLIFAALVFFALGLWQIQRLHWKLQLICAVDKRLHAPASPAPGPTVWSGLNAGHDAYRRVQVRGGFLDGRETLTQAVTEKGPGFWVVAPFKTDQGFVVLINRGFVPAEAAASGDVGRGKGDRVVTGLLRFTEPGGGFLRRNDPAGRRWYSRDVAAIAAADGVQGIAPYFIDADATPNPGGWPMGGLTVVHFRNSHLLYALTWFALAAMSIGWIIHGLRAERAATQAP